ncbi:MAG: hypothetical protein NVS4B3_00230 [Gemmatimonadaceae bacterium]
MPCIVAVSTFFAPAIPGIARIDDVSRGDDDMSFISAISFAASFAESALSVCFPVDAGRSADTESPLPVIAPDGGVIGCAAP